MFRRTDALGHRSTAQCIKPNTQSFVLDAEAVAYDVDEKKILPFQELSKRKRKDVKAEDIKVKVHIFAFDLLYVNGEVGVGWTARPKTQRSRES